VNGNPHHKEKQQQHSKHHRARTHHELERDQIAAREQKRRRNLTSSGRSSSRRERGGRRWDQSHLSRRSSQEREEGGRGPGEMRRRPGPGKSREREGEHLYGQAPPGTRSTLSTPGRLVSFVGWYRLGPGHSRLRSGARAGDLPLPPLSLPAQSGKRLETVIQIQSKPTENGDR
jgi:hypothetical protein